MGDSTPEGATFYIRGDAPAHDTHAHTHMRARKEGIMAGTFDSNRKLLETKLKDAGLYSAAICPTMNECAKIMTRIHHYNREVVEHHYRTSMPDGKRPPELIALENASRELLNYLKALGLVAGVKAAPKTGEKQTAQPVSSPMAEMAAMLAQFDQSDDK